MAKWKRSPRLFLVDILESIDLIDTYLDGMSKADFEQDQGTQDSVERRIEIIAEASKHIPVDLKNAHPEIPWPAILSMRNFLSHEYFAVANQSVWNVVQNHLAPLRRTVVEMLDDLPADPE